MKIGLYSPYVPKQFGGGEKYFFDVARMCVELGHDVSVLLSQDIDLSANSENAPRHIQKTYENFLGVSLDNIKFVHSPFGANGSSFSKLQFSKQFDAIYLVTDGSLFYSLAKKNILHIQIPFTQPKTGFMERSKLINWKVKNTNSNFTKSIIEKSWRTKIQFVHHPMIDLPNAGYEPDKKEKIILSVGRFFDHLHSKRQDVLVTAFKQLLEDFPKESRGWKLVLVGPVEDQKYADKIAEMSKGFPIELKHKTTRSQLDELYQKATFYWHAAGFEVDEKKSPEKVEHFGISTVEAMNYGCVPVVVGKGGQVEVLGENLSTLLWQNTEQVTQITASLIERQNIREQFAQLALEQAKHFGKEQFVKTLKEMLK